MKWLCVEEHTTRGNTSQIVNMTSKEEALSWFKENGDIRGWGAGYHAFPVVTIEGRDFVIIPADHRLFG